MITEIMAANDGVLLDEDNEPSDWVELANLGDEAINLAGYYLTDDPDALNKWTLPDLNLAPGEHTIIFASGKDRAVAGNTLHTNFRLDADGEPLALVEPNGQTIVSSFAPEYPQQFRNVSYGDTDPSSSTNWINPNSSAKILVPTAADDAAISLDWTGGNRDFDDSGWIDGTASVGYRISPFLPQNGVPGTIAYNTPAAASGSQAISGPLGMDFVVTRPIAIVSLGAFDDGSNGFARPITVELWSRDDQGTPNYFRDDTGDTILASATFPVGNSGVLVGGTRYLSFSSPLILQPGNYTISAEGYGLFERNAVGAEGGSFGELADTTAIQFVGHSRYGVDNRFFPGFEDVGAANRYGAGSFSFIPLDPDPPAESSTSDDVIAYGTRPGLGNATTSDNVGMEFQVNRPIRITELGVFDSGQDGIEGALGVSIWSRVTGERLAEATFIGDDGVIEPGTGSRFLRLNEPVLLPAGIYSVVASGFIGNDPLSRFDGGNHRIGTLGDNEGAISFVGTSSTTTFEANRFFEEYAHRLTDSFDTGPVDKFAAGTFKFEAVFDDYTQTDLVDELFGVSSSAYVRIPFEVGDISAIDQLLLNINFDDGYVAFLNGAPFFSRNAPATFAYDAVATAGVGDDVTIAGDLLDITGALPFIIPNDTNYLTFQILNVNPFSVDMGISVTLDAVQKEVPFRGYFIEPTPGSPNGNGLLGFVDDTELDGNGNLTVTLSTATENASIYYTTDGSLPDADNGTLYTGPLAIGTTTTLRARAVLDQFVPSSVATMTYLFLDDILGTTGIPDGLPGHWNGDPADYGFTQNPDDLIAIAGDPTLTVNEALDVIKDSLRSLPTMSIVLDNLDLFGTTHGLYTNPFPRGRLAEQPASVEYYLPDGTLGYQIDAGLRMMGWTSRVPFVSPKHSLRLAFRDDYGSGRLNYPMFPDSPVDSFDTLSLRNNSRDTWLSDYPFPTQGGPEWGAMRSMATYIRDQWSKTVMQDMGEIAPHGNFVHLYLNGVYWGVYNPTERPDGAYVSELNGGSEDDYDSVVFCNPTSRTSHGDLEMWNTMIELADGGVAGDAEFQRLLGNNPDGTRNPDFPVLLDTENFINYMIAGQYDATDDWPCNFYAVRERNQNDEPFHFITWDNDLALPVGDVAASRLNIDLTGTPVSSPWRFQAVLERNAEYRLEFADQVHKHLFNDGVLSPESAVQRWFELGQQVRPGLFAEAARWGDYRRDVTFAGPATQYTVTDHWDVFNDFMLSSYLPQRSLVYVDQLRAYGLYPSIDAPELNQHGGEVMAGFPVSLSAPQGTIYYTTDGSDPRLPTTTRTLVSGNAPKRVFIPTALNGGAGLGASWRGASTTFNDSAWTAGTGGVGYEADAFGTYSPFIDIDVLDTMGGVTGSAFIRIPFELDAADLADFDFLDLNVRYDDGFVAFLNGVRIASANAPNTLSHTSVATAQNADAAAMLFESFDVSAFTSALRAGQNILAIHGLNAGATSSDFLISAELVGGASRTGTLSPDAIEYTGPLTLTNSATIFARAFDGTEWSASTEATFHVDTGLRVSEINFNPPGDDTTEFVELVNTSSVTLDLTGVRFTDGIEFEFLPTESKLSLAPGEYILIASNPAAFAVAYPAVPADRVADNPYTGQFDNGGEHVVLEDAGGGTTQEFTYEDTWYPDADGGGKSIVVVDINGDRANWNLPTGWKLSGPDGGTPGAADPAAIVVSEGPDELELPYVRVGHDRNLGGLLANNFDPDDLLLGLAANDLPVVPIGADEEEIPDGDAEEFFLHPNIVPLADIPERPTVDAERLALPIARLRPLAIPPGLGNHLAPRQVVDDLFAEFDGQWM
jgi:hypothetical protein